MEPVLAYVAVAVCSYLIGSFSTSYIIGKIKKVDLKKTATKNLGASNTAVVLGWKWGIVVGAADIFKGCLAVILTRLLAPDYPAICYVAGACAVFGHIFPFYLKFNGGKGFATYIGVILGLDWKMALILAFFIITLALVTNYIVTGTMITVVTFPVYTFFMTGEWYSALIMALASAVIIYKHRINLRRIKDGTESKVRTMFQKNHKEVAKAEIEKVNRMEQEEKESLKEAE